MAGPSLVIRTLGFNDAYRAIDRYGVRPMEQAWSRASMAGARIAASAMRAAAPVGETKKLQRSTRARRGRSRGIASLASGQMGTAIAGPTARHRHLVIRGHRIVTRGGRDTGRRTRPNPFVDRAAEASRPLWEEAVKRELYRA